MEVNEKENVVFEDPKQYDGRTRVASACALNLGIEFPAIVDTIENTTETAYTAWPDRLYLIDERSRIAFKSEAGPFGFKTELLSKALEQLVPLTMKNGEP